MEETYETWNAKPLSKRMAIAAEYIRMYESGIQIQYQAIFPGAEGEWWDLTEDTPIWWKDKQQFHRYIWRVKPDCPYNYRLLEARKRYALLKESLQEAELMGYTKQDNIVISIASAIVNLEQEIYRYQQ